MATVALSIAAGSCNFNFSNAAIEDTKIAGCEITVESNSGLGPLTHYEVQVKGVIIVNTYKWWYLTIPSIINHNPIFRKLCQTMPLQQVLLQLMSLTCPQFVLERKM